MLSGSKKDLKYFKGMIMGFRDALMFRFFGLFPIQSNKIAVTNFHGKGYGDNPKYIVEELLRRQSKLNTNRYEIVWFVNNMKEELPREVKKVKNNALNRAYHQSTSSVWISNVRKLYGTKKRNGQLYIQTWHGPIGFKPVGALMNESSKVAYQASVNDSKMADYFVSNSSWCSDMYRKAFYYNGKMLETGSPRCDILFGEKGLLCENIRKNFDLPKDAKILIYAPTFRGGADRSSNSFKAGNSLTKFDSLIELLEERFLGKWFIFLRQHPRIAESSPMFSEYQDHCRIREISKEVDLYKILSASDAMISDYSSVAFDAAYMRIPVFLYADDMETYEQERGSLLWDMDQLPFPFARTQQELFENIKKFDKNKYLSELETLFRQVGLLEDGHASERVADVIDRFLKEGVKP